MNTPSELYEKAVLLGQRHHDNQAKTFSGQFTWKQKSRIKEVIDEYGIESILDYGCGAGKQYKNRDENGLSLEQYWGVHNVTKYDPCVRAFDREPEGKFDLVICVQVLGSIPKRDLPWVVDRLYGFATKAVFVAERVNMTPHKRIYEDIQDEMPYGMSGEKWLSILRREGQVPLIAVLKNSEFREGGGWFTVTL